MAEITSLPIVSKANVGTNDYLLVANSSTKKARKLSAQSLFASISTVGTGSEDLFASVTNRNQINFKGLKSGDTGLLTVATTSNNLVLTVLESGIDLSLCNNATSAFLTTVALSNATGTLAVSRGGTGLSSIIKGSVLYSSAADTITSTTLTTDGQLLIGNSTLGYPTTGTLLSGDGTITVTNTAGGIDLSVTSTSKLTSVLDADRFNINLNTSAAPSFLSGDGSNEGITVDALGRVFAGDSTPTVPTLTAGLTIGGAADVALQLGQLNGYENKTIKFADSASGTAGMAAKIEGADAGGGNVSGGSVTVEAGSAAGSGTGGNVVVQAGNADGSVGGAIQLKTYTSKNTSATAMSIASTGAITNAGATTLSSSLAVTGTSTFTAKMQPGSGGLMQSPPVVMADSNAALTLAANAGRTTVIPDVSGDRIYTLPDPTTAGEYYHIVGFGALAADGHDITIQGVNNDNTTFFHGAVIHHDTNNTAQTSAVVWGDGDSNDTIKLDLVEAFDLHFLASTSAPTTMYYVWGWTAGITPVTITD